MEGKLTPLEDSLSALDKVNESAFSKVGPSLLYYVILLLKIPKGGINALETKADLRGLGERYFTAV